VLFSSGLDVLPISREVGRGAQQQRIPRSRRQSHQGAVVSTLPTTSTLLPQNTDEQEAPPTRRTGSASSGDDSSTALTEADTFPTNDRSSKDVETRGTGVSRRVRLRRGGDADADEAPPPKRKRASNRPDIRYPKCDIQLDDVEFKCFSAMADNATRRLVRYGVENCERMMLPCPVQKGALKCRAVVQRYDHLRNHLRDAWHRRNDAALGCPRCGKQLRAIDSATKHRSGCRGKKEGR